MTSYDSEKVYTWLEEKIDLAVYLTEVLVEYRQINLTTITYKNL